MKYYLCDVYNSYKILVLRELLSSLARTADLASKPRAVNAAPNKFSNMRGGGLQRSSEQDGGVESPDVRSSTTRTTRGPGGAAPRGSRSHGQRDHKKPGVCRFYVTSTCKYGNRCKYYHPKPPANLSASGERGDISSEKRPAKPDEHSTRRAPSDLNLGMFMKPAAKSRVPVQRPEVGGSKTANDLLKVSTVPWYHWCAAGILVPVATTLHACTHR